MHQVDRRVAHFRRLPTGQSLLTVGEGDQAVLDLPVIGCEIPLSEVYEDTDLLDEVAAEGA